jgi:uncharacterized protein (TIGR03435 family)
MKLVVAFGCISLLLAHAESFEVASLKRSQIPKGVDYRGRVVIAADRLGARNVTLQHLVAVAYDVQHSQVSSSGLKWLDTDEFDIEARAGRSATPQELRAMLQTLLAERFKLIVSRQEKELRVYALVVDKGGPKIQPSTDSKTGHFHGTMQQFADLLAIQATIPAALDPASPAMASSEPLVVIDKTGLDGLYDIDADLKPELGTDRFTQWQRVLREQLGLRLEGQRSKVTVLVVTSAERVPAGN